MDERLYTVPLIKAKSVPRTRRAKRAIKEIKEFLARHMKAEEVKIDSSINELVWARGIKKIPTRVRVKAVKIDDVVWAYTPEAEVKIGEKEEKGKKKETPPEEKEEEIKEETAEEGVAKEEAEEITKEEISAEASPEKSKEEETSSEEKKEVAKEE